MTALTVMILWLGLYPAPVLARMQSSAERFVHSVETRGDQPAMRLGGGR
jgi:NADH:ubiquinone oxidoreductase subunit 4 (subunit M)